MNKFIKLFLSETNYKIDNIDFEKTKYYRGFNNSSCFIETFDGILWHIKIGCNSEKSIRNEINFLEKYWDKKFYKQKNSFIKEIKEGVTVTLELILNDLKKLEKLISDFHLPRNIIEVDYLKYLNSKTKKTDVKLFKALLIKHQNQKIVLSHNDVNLKNMMLNNELFLIDFEWSKNNYIWFDIINFIREENLSLEQIKKIIKFFKYLDNLENTLEFLFINTFFSLTWAMQIKNNLKKNEYILKIENQLSKIKKWMKEEI